MARRDIVLIGGSAGSAEVVKGLMAGLPEGFPASLFITTHLPTGHRSHMPELLSDAGPLRVVRAAEGQRIEPGCAYVAPSDRHLLLMGSVISLGDGPRENMARPSIDPMFRSAALSFGSRVVGVVLSGLLNDGAEGLQAIKAQGGTTVVQHPLDSAEGDMPRAAIAATEIDHVITAADLAGLLDQLVRSDAGPPRPPSDDLVFEVEVAAGTRIDDEALRRITEPSGLAWPDRQGRLSQANAGGRPRFRRRIDDASSADRLAVRHRSVDEAIRIATRIMEERLELVRRMARDARAGGRTAVAELYERRAGEYRRHAAVLREAALDTRRGEEPAEPEQPI